MRAARYGILLPVLSFTMWGARRLPQPVGCKNADRVFATCGIFRARARRLWQGPAGRGGSGRAVGSERRSRQRRPAGPSRAARAAWTARRTRPAQPKHPRYSVGLPDWRLHRFLPRRRSPGQRLLRTGAQSRDLYRRAANLMRRRGQHGQRAAGRDLCGLATITDTTARPRSLPSPRIAGWKMNVVRAAVRPLPRRNFAALARRVPRHAKLLRRSSAW
jgi:hypothetical protein